MTGTSSSRGFQVGLALIALAAFALRVFPFFGPDGAWGYRVDYDEGVYFSAAAELLRGVLPYRDFVFVHPPGILLLLASTSAWTQGLLGVDGAFALSRWVAALVGVLNVLLVARLVLRFPGSTVGALVAAAFYATYPELVQVERGPFLEPFLNLACLAMASAAIESATRRRWLLAAGALAGVAVAIKLWAILWVVGALWAVTRFASRRELLQFVAAAAGTFGLLVLPFVLLAPDAFLREVVLFHLWRPPDGTVDRILRFEQIFAARHLASPLLALLMVGVLTREKSWSLAARIFAPTWVLTLAAFFASAAYWNQYNAHLIASEAVLAGAAVAWLLPRLPRLVRAAAGALVLVAVGVSVTHVFKRSRSDTRHLALARSSLKSTDGCVFTFEPSWALAAGRLPPPLPGGGLIIDSYALQLLDATATGQRFPTADSAFAVSPLPVGLEGCRYVVPGERGNRQLSASAWDQLRSRRTRVELPGLEVWELRE